MQGMEKAAEIAGLERAFADAHGGAQGHAFASAPIAVSAILDLLDNGNRIVVPEGLRTDVSRMTEGIRRRSAGLGIDIVDMTDPAALERTLAGETRMIWVELLAGPRLSMPDTGAIAALAKARDIPVVVDVSALGHGMARPLEDGCQIVFSALAGENDGSGEAARGGLVSFAAGRGLFEDRFAFLHMALDALPSRERAAAMHDRLKHVPGDMAARAATARALAGMLAGQDFILECLCPVNSDPAGPDGGVVQKDGEAGVPELSVTFRGEVAEIAPALARLEHFTPAARPGDPGSFWHYAMRDFEAVPGKLRHAMGITDGLVRIGVPPVAPEGLIADFRSAFG